MGRRFLAVAAATLLIAACAGDAGGAPDAEPPDRAAGGQDGEGASEEAPSELRVALGGESEDGYDPTMGWGAYGAPLFQSTVLSYTTDLDVEGDLATGWGVSDDGLTWTVQIRDDVVFSDGEPLTAHDVAYTFTTAAQAGSVVDLTALETAEATDDTTVEFALAEPRSTFVHRLATLGVVPEHAHDDGYARAPVGSGPFVLERWDEGQQLIAARNPDYHGQPPAFERIVFLFTEEDATIAAARSSELHLASVPQALADEPVDGMELVAAESVDNRGLTFPMVTDDGGTDAQSRPVGNDVTADPAVRRAINHAVDRQALVDGILSGHGSPAYGPVDGLPWFEPESIIDDADPDGATQILTEAGWEPGDDGILEKDGLRAELELLYPAQDSVRQGLTVAVADMIAPLGFDVAVEGVDWDAIEERSRSQPVAFGWGSHDPAEMYNLYHSSGAERDDFFNVGHYASDAVDAHLDAAMTATDPDEAAGHWRAAQLDADGNGFSARADAAWVWLVNLDHTYLADECLDLGPLQVEPHGHGWPVTAGITRWRWSC